MRRQRRWVAAWLGGATAVMVVGYESGHPVVAGVCAVFGLLLPARYWEGLRPGMPGFHLKLRSAETVTWVQDRPQDYIPRDEPPKPWKPDQPS